MVGLVLFVWGFMAIPISKVSPPYRCSWISNQKLRTTYPQVNYSYDQWWLMSAISFCRDGEAQKIVVLARLNPINTRLPRTTNLGHNTAFKGRRNGKCNYRVGGYGNVVLALKNDVLSCWRCEATNDKLAPQYDKWSIMSCWRSENTTKWQ